MGLPIWTEVVGYTSSCCWVTVGKESRRAKNLFLQPWTEGPKWLLRSVTILPESSWHHANIPEWINEQPNWTSKSWLPATTTIKQGHRGAQCFYRDVIDNRYQKEHDEESRNLVLHEKKINLLQSWKKSSINPPPSSPLPPSLERLLQKQWRKFGARIK